MKKTTLLFFYVNLVIILPHCATSTKTKKHTAVKIYKQAQGFRRFKVIKAEEYVAKIEGIECPFCVETVIALIKKIDGVIEAFYHKGVQGYEDGVLVFTWDIRKEENPRLKIEESLKKEEFILNSLDHT